MTSEVEAAAADERREMSLREALDLAISLHRQGKLGAALQLYDQILARFPDDAEALHFSGLLAHQQGRSADAVDLIHRSLREEPDQPDPLSNLGLALKGLGRLDEAEAAYRRALALAPDHGNAWNNLAAVLRAQDRLDAAEEAYREAIRHRPDHGEAHHNLGLLLFAAGRRHEAVLCFCRSLTLSASDDLTSEKRRVLAYAYTAIGERKKAAAIYEDWFRDEPHNPVARHLLAALSGEAPPERAADECVELMFDSFAGTFDTKLADLGYRAPELVAAVLADAMGEPAGDLDILDAGCGTGLCGPLLRPYARRLHGVDLSVGMLKKAAERPAVYDALAKAELTDFLRRHAGEYDVVVSADTLCYFGPLEEVSAAAAGALRPGGLFIFTVEDGAALNGEGTYWLEPHGRYSHAERYVAAALADAGFAVEIVPAELRLELGAPVRGLVAKGVRQRS
jgi:predicted TPR repeat methyltransferase